MNEQFSTEVLMMLIDNVNRMRPERETFFLTASAWQYELSLHPERFAIYNGELLWCGSKVGVVASEQKKEKFQRMVNQFVSDGIICCKE